MQIYVHRNNQQLGPFTEAEIKAQLAAGSITAQDHVWWQGQEGWVPLAQSPLMATLSSSVPGLATIPPGPLSPGVPPSVAQTAKLAIGPLFWGCLSIICGLFASIPAIVLGHMGRAEIKKNPSLQGSGMALAGVILGYVFSAFFIVYLGVIGVSVLIALGNQVKTAPSFQLKSDQSSNSDSQPSSNSDQTTNVPDQSASAPATLPDQSTNNAPASTNAPDASTNAPASTNSPDANASSSQPSTNAPVNSTNAAPMSQ